MYVEIAKEIGFLVFTLFVYLNVGYAYLELLKKAAETKDKKWWHHMLLGEGTGSDRLFGFETKKWYELLYLPICNFILWVFIALAYALDGIVDGFVFAFKAIGKFFFGGFAAFVIKRWAFLWPIFLFFLMFWIFGALTEPSPERVFYATGILIAWVIIVISAKYNPKKAEAGKRKAEWYPLDW